VSRLDELIQEFCPDGVEYKALGAIGSVVRGKRFVKDDMIDAGVPCIHYGEIYTKYGVSASEAISFVSKERAKTLRFAQPGDVIIASAGETVEDIGKAVAWLGESPIAIHDACYAFSSAMDAQYVSYFFSSRLFRDQIRQQISSSKISSISTHNIAKARIPVPPLEVQREIVRVLNQFTQLEAELTAQLKAELEARRRQYEHYRTGVFALPAEGDVRWSTLGDVSVKVSSGGTPSSGRAAYYGGDIPWLRTQEVDFGPVFSTGVTITEDGLQNSSANWIPERCVIVAMYGATAAKVATNAIPLTTNQACCNLQIDPAQAEYQYVFYWVASQYEQLKSLGEGSQANLNARKVKTFPIPVPSLEEQRRIVALLDEFDALVNELTVGLPAELMARRKQYEYYRDRLLTFEEAAA
jgi:type I restriction enzyme S subunit